MNRDQALELLRAGPVGIRKWNEWRDELGNETGGQIGSGNRLPSLVEANLEGINLTDADLRSIDLTRANLQACTLRRCILSRANLTHAQVEDADLRGSHLDEARIDGANLRGANLDGASLKEASLFEADLKGAHLLRARLARANLRSADLRGAYLRSAYLRDADLSFARLDGAHLRGAYLRGATLEGISSDGAYWRDAILDSPNAGARTHRPTLHENDSFDSSQHEDSVARSQFLAFARIRLDAESGLLRLSAICKLAFELCVASFRVAEAPRLGPAYEALARGVHHSVPGSQALLVSHAEFAQWLRENDPHRHAQLSRAMSVSHISLSLGGSLELIFDPASIAGCTAALTLTGFVEELRRHDGSVALFDESLSQVFCDILLNSLQALGCQPTNDHVARLQLEARELVRAIGVHNISAPSYHWLEAKLQESIRLRSGVCAPINRIDQRQVGRHHVAQSIEDSL